ncbi:MAG: multiheme c-type cytochrome [Blastopirellula sp. JB062]
MLQRLVQGRRVYGALVLLIAALAVAALTLPGQPEAVAIPHTITPGHYPYDPDWPDVFLILQNKCAGCHRPESDRVDLSSYEAMIDAEKHGQKLIVPGNPKDSLLWEYVNWNVHQDPKSIAPREPEMPVEKSDWLTAGQLETMQRWITNGALEYTLPISCKPPVTEMDFPSAKQCAACHPKQYDEWSRSMHAYAQQSPIFEAFTLTLQERTGGTIGTFCTRCHTPVGIALGETGSTRNVHRSRISLEGVTCITCHRRSTVHYKSSGRVPVEPGPVLDACMYGPFDDSVSGPHNGTHQAEGFPYMKSSQFCGECHDVTSADGVRLEEAFSEWQNSPAAKMGQTCQSCHMGPVQGKSIADCDRPLGYAAIVPGVPKEQMPLRHLTDHTFAGPDYSLLPDTEFPEKLDWMYETDYRDWDKLTPYQKETLVALRKKNRRSLRIADAKRYEVLRNAAVIHVDAPPTAQVGRKTAVRVDVESIMAGHSLPTGFTAERQVWVEITVRDPQGRVVYASGNLDKNADLRDDHSHQVLTGEIPYDRDLLNFQNKFVALSNKGTDRTVVLSVNRNVTPVNVLRPASGVSASFGRPGTFRIAKGSLPPLATRGQTYKFSPDCPGPYHVDVRLNFRHLPPTLLDHIGTPHLKHLLEIVVIDSWNGVIEVTP